MRWRSSTGYRVLYNTSRGPAKGGIRFDLQRHARRGEGARRVDDVEMRGGEYAVRRREGRRRLRSARDERGRARAAHAPLHRRHHQHARSGLRRSRAGRQHERARDGVDHGHLLHARRPHRDRRRHRQAGRDGRLARPARSDGPRLHDRHEGGAPAPRNAGEGNDRRGAGIRQRRLGRGAAARARRLQDRGDQRPVGRLYNKNGIDIDDAIAHVKKHARSRATTAATRSRTKSC